MPESATPRPPSGLDATGRRLWRQVQRAIEPDAELDERDLAVLELAARQADDVARLERMLKRARRPTVAGSTGQVRLHPAIAELRQARLALARLLTSLNLEIGKQDSAASARARRAAEARWRGLDRTAVRRLHGAA